MKATDGAVICKKRLITYNAIPYPLPAAWSSELMAARGIVAINAVEVRMRETIGVPVTRDCIYPISLNESGE